MAEVKFYLEKRKDKQSGELITENVPIFLFYSFKGHRLQYYTGLRIPEIKYWNGAGMKAQRHEDASEINRELTRLKAQVEGIEAKAKALGDRLTPEYFRDRLSGKKKEANNASQIWEFYEAYLKELQLSKTKNTIASAKQNLKILKAFSEKRRYKMTFDRIDFAFYNEFLDYCYNERGFFNNNTGTQIKRLKSFLTWSWKKGYHTNREYKRFRKPYEDIDIIYLHWEELMKFYKHKFKTREYAEVRDMYCFGCFSGMRYSDIVALTPGNVKEEFIQNRIVKTKQANVVPLNPYSKKILQKYKDKIPGKSLPQYSPTQLFKYLKDAMKEAELDREIEIIHYKGAERTTETKPLWDAATFHTSKKTFVTNFLERGGSLTTAMAITGNKDWKVIRRYFKIADKLRAQEMSKVFGELK